MIEHPTIVHIGRHKTGTSALQWTLHDDPEGLRRHDVLYPVAGRDPHGRGRPTWAAHHALANELNGAGPGEVAAAIAGERHEFDGRVIVSSEALQNVDADALAKVFDPATTAVVIYVREQVSYVLSGYAQRIQASDTTESVEHYVRRMMRRDLDYARRLGDLAHVFGRDNVVVRIYEPDRLVGGSTVTDFLALVGLEGELEPSERGSNVSLTDEVILYKRLWNAFGLDPTENYYRLSDVSVELGGERTAPISAELQTEVRQRFAASNREVFDEWAGLVGGQFVERDHARAQPQRSLDDLVALIERVAAAVHADPPESQ